MTTQAVAPLPSPGTRVRCIDATDRPELTLNQVYVVAGTPLGGLPINHARFQPDDFRFIAVVMAGKEVGFFPNGVFEPVK